MPLSKKTIFIPPEKMKELIEQYLVSHSIIDDYDEIIKVHPFLDEVTDGIHVKVLIGRNKLIA